MLVAAAVVIVLALAENGVTENGVRKPASIPTIVMMYHEKHEGNLQYFSWQGNDPPPPNTHFPYIAKQVNVTKGDQVEFLAVNTTRQPDYYVVSVQDETTPTPPPAILEDYRLTENKLLIDYDKNRPYGIYLTAVWVYADLFGQQTDYVRYSFPVEVK